MDFKIVLVLLAAAGIAGTAFGYFLRWIISLGKRGSMELEIKQRTLEAKEEAKQITADAQRRADELIANKQEELREKEEKLSNTEDRLVKKEELLDKRQLDLDREDEDIKRKQQELEQDRGELERLRQARTYELEKVSGLSREDARLELFNQLEHEHERELTARLQKLNTAAREQLEARAKDILTTAIHRLGNAVPADVLATSVELPSDEMKGKVIGKEGRNIKAFERATGVDVLIDDTPNVLSLSSFDPVRRQIARVALEKLIADGRIQPAKIEEAVASATEEIQETIQQKGQEAANEVGIYELDPRLLSVLGRLHFRTSYGQNVLQHSIEVAHLSAMLAAELGANVHVAKCGGLLHDIGKAVDHEVAGTHVEIGRRILQKFGVDDEVIKAMQAHHEEYPYENTESIIVQVADAISGGRPGARRDTLEQYMQRLEDLEAIATAHAGIERAYAIQAGREVRIFVRPEEVSEYASYKLARDIARQIQEQLNFPGEIKINVIRESRVIEYAR